VANAQVEKLKALGLRHGEKAVVGLASVLCLLLLFFAVTMKTIPLTSDELASDAKRAESNLNAPQARDDILKRLQDDWLKTPGFEKLVDSQSKNTLVADNYKADHPWVTLEPGAGLIRDTPKVIAPADLVAYPGRGGALVFALEDGKRVLEDPDKKKDTATEARRQRKGRPRRSRNRGMMGMSGMMGGPGGMMGMPGMGGRQEDPEKAKKEYEYKSKRLKRQLAGEAKPEDEKAKGKEGENPEEQGPEGPYKEITKGLRWVSLVGVLDHKKMKENYATALKYATAAPNYKGLDVQRQVLQSDGTWSDWEDVDGEKNQAISNNIPEEDEELTPDDVRLDALVDPLPFLTSGYWEKVHVVSLVPKEKREIPKPEGGMVGGEGGMMPGSAGMMGRGGMMMMGGGSEGMPGGRMMGGRGMMMMGGSGMMMGGGAGEDTNFPKSDADTIMIRSLDYTAEPDTTYKYRLRVVCYNPNYKREDVSPGVDTTDVELKGDWSEPTDPVTMPADVAAYAMRKAPPAAGAKRPDQVSFQVARWNPSDGVTVVRTFSAGPGEILGEPLNSSIPATDGTKPKSKLVDFNSHEIVLDATGGPQRTSAVGATGAPLDMPALSLLLRPDGTVMVRSQADDLLDPVRKDMDENYKRELKESEAGSKRENSLGSMYSGMMRGRGGGMMRGAR
jgi:hypothetical protein